jgi:prevent-host-death family protein
MFHNRQKRQFVAFLCQATPKDELTFLLSSPTMSYNLYDRRASMIQTFDSNQARARWRDLLDAAQTNETDVVITRYNKPVVAMLAYEDYVAIREELQRQRARRAARRRREAESLPP